MLRTIFFVLWVLGINVSFAQIQFKTEHVTRITYQVSSNGNTDENQIPIWVFADQDNVLITNRDQFQEKGKHPFEMTFVQPNQKKYTQFAYLNPTESISMLDSESIDKQEFELLDETKMILGYHCKKAKTIINSNTIEIWYTNELNFKGGPSVLGQNLGLVLELV